MNTILEAMATDFAGLVLYAIAAIVMVGSLVVCALSLRKDRR